MAFYLGIDGGGTKTTCGLGDETRLLSTALAGGCNPVRHGAERARTTVQSAVSQACIQANVSPQAIARSCIGVAGISAPGVAPMLSQAISDVVSGEVLVVGDHQIALEAAFGKCPGVIVIAGTGSIAWGRDAQGRKARAGGYGYAISDEGSGEWIGRTAIAHTLRALDRGTTPRLYRLIVDGWKIDADALIKTANAVPQPDFAALCPLVIQASHEGDCVATDVLSRAGAELAELASAVLIRLWQQDQPVGVAMVGGVFRNSAIVREQFAKSLRSLNACATVEDTVVDPMLGALILARTPPSIAQTLLSVLA
jgi:N-acetylglucosamine kinase-like BadF-type ATPase